jgi:hypothetical protein
MSDFQNELSISNLDVFDQHHRLFVKQQKELVEIILDWETANKYTVFNEHKTPLLFIVEKKKGFFDALKRFVFRSHRSFEVDVFDTHKRPLLRIVRPFYWIWSDMMVYSSDNQLIGSVHRRFSLFFKKYTLRDNRQREFATIKSAFWRIWTFPVYNMTGKEIALISKKWTGFLKEIFTDSDSYLVEYKLVQKLPLHKSLIFAASISIDFYYFENNQGRSGGVFGKGD